LFVCDFLRLDERARHRPNKVETALTGNARSLAPDIFRMRVISRRDERASACGGLNNRQP
jgi:hypothetical protein